jgi:hypothetical protein
MNNLILRTCVLSSILLSLIACSDKTGTTNSSTASNVSTVTTKITTDAWLGKWNGPEGTFLEISGGSGNYEITIQDLDGPKKYHGTNKDNQISFDRNGTSEIIEASSGADTGMKWLAEKSNCLRTRLGEGWCRD